MLAPPPPLLWLLTAALASPPEPPVWAQDDLIEEPPSPRAPFDTEPELPSDLPADLDDGTSCDRATDQANELWSEPGVVDFAPFGDGVGELWLVATVRAGNHVEHTVDGPFFADDVSVALEVPDALHAITDRGTVSVRVVARDGDVTLAQWTLPRVVWREIDGHTEFSAAADQEERLITSGEVVYADANL